jgi:hypothetical protein
MVLPFPISFANGFRGALALLLALLFAGAPAMAAETPSSMETLQKIATLVETFQSDDVGALFRAVRQTNPSQGAIKSLREVYKALDDKNKEPGATKLPIAGAAKASILGKMTAAQRRIKAVIETTRPAAHLNYAAKYAGKSRTLVGNGDVGSWPDNDVITSDVDSTVFGTDKSATREFVDDFLNPLLLANLAGQGSGLDLKEDFDIVITPEGWESEAGVFETRGGKSVALALMVRLTPVNADGTLGTTTRGDIAKELANARIQARLRTLATRMGVYDQFFDAVGRFKRYDASRNPAQEEAWVSFMEAADDEGLLEFDTKLTKAETLAGTCLDMAKHLHHEAIEQLGTLDKSTQIKRIMKYPGRSEWAYGKSGIASQIVEQHVVMGDPKLRRLLQQAREFHRTKESKALGAKEALAVMIDRLAGEYPDSAELGKLALTLTVRQTHLAMRVQLDKIVKIEDATARNKQIQDLIDDFSIVNDGPLLDFAEAQKGALIKLQSISNDPEAFEAIRKARSGLEIVNAEKNRAPLERARVFMDQSELGKKINEVHEGARALADTIKKKMAKITYPIDRISVEVSGAYEQLKESSSTLQLIEALKDYGGNLGETAGVPTKTIVEVANKLGTYVDIIDAVGKSKTDADLALNLGKALWSNSAVGGIVNSLYAFTVGGDNEALAKFVMFAVCPAAAVPELVTKIGSFAARTGAQRLFDMQLDALYRASKFAGDPEFSEQPQWKGKNPWLLADFIGYGAGAPAAVAFLDDLLLPGGYVAAEKMVTNLKVPQDDNAGGNDAIARAAVAKAVWMTLALGDHLVMKDDGALAEATQRIKLLTDEIIFLAQHMGKEVARAPENFNMPDGTSPGEQAALNKLVKERDVWVTRAKAAMGEAITRSFEERRRAEGDLSDKAMKKRLEELRAILTRLEILDPGLSHLSEEGSYNFLVRNIPLAVSNKQQLRKMVEAINRYYDTYSQILSLRDAISQLAQVQTGRALSRPPLTGSPPLCGERSIDLQSALPFFEKVRGANTETVQSLAGIKGAPLAGEFDDRIRRGINFALYEMAQAEASGNMARACAAGKIVGHRDFIDTAAKSTEYLGIAQKRRDALMKEFIEFYAGIKALSANIVLTPAAPIQGQPVAAELRLSAGAAPAGATWIWTLEDGGSTVGSYNGVSVRFQAPFRGRYVLKAALALAGVSVKTFATEFDVAPRPGLNIALVPPDPAPGQTLVADASLSPPRGDVTFEWRCDGCTVTSQQGNRASLQAPDRGRATVRVTARRGGGQPALAEASAGFQVGEPKPPVIQPPVGDQTNARPPTTTKVPNKPGTDQLPPKTGKNAVTPIDGVVPPTSQESTAGPDSGKPGDSGAATGDLPIGTWSQAVAARDKYLADQKSATSAAEKARLAEKLAAAEGRMRELWDAAQADVSGLPAYVTRYMAELDRIYKAFHVNAPQKPTGPEGSGVVVTDLEGNTATSRYQCVLQMDREYAEQAAKARELLAKATAVEALFSKPYDGGGGYVPAMQAFDALWQGQTLFARNWRTAGFDRAVHNPCDQPPNDNTHLKLEPVGAAPTKPQSAADKKPALSVALQIEAPAKGKSEIGVQAKTTGGVAPYRYRWTGARSDSGDRAIYAAPVGKNAKARAAVQLTDAVGGTASAEIDLQPVLLSLRLTKTGPPGSELAVGAEALFAVELTGDGQAVDPSKYTLRWEPSTEAHFKKAEGSGVVANSASWPKSGKVKVWVVALQQDGGKLSTVGESNQIELSITAPKISLKVEPADPFVGQEVKVTATATPAVPEADASYWWEYSGAAANPGPTANQRVYSLIPKSTAPVSVTAHLKAKTGGEELAKETATVTAREYKVTIVNLGPAFENVTTRPVIWKPGVGLVTLDKEIAAHQDIALRADIADPAPPQPLRYRWSVDQGSRVSGNTITRETRVQRADKGGIEAKVEVLDSHDAVLGVATTSIEVTISDEDLATGKQKSAELARLKEEATKAWADGDLDAACDKAKAAAQIDPKFPEGTTYCAGRDRVLALTRGIEPLLKPAAGTAELARAQSLLDQASAVNAKAKPLAELARRLKELKDLQARAEALLATAARAWQDGDAIGALKAAREAVAATPGNAEAEKQQKRYLDGSTRLEAAVRTGKAAVIKRDYAQASSAVSEGKKTLANYKPLLELEQEIAKAQQADARAEQQRQQQLAQLRSGNESCTARAWQECQSRLEAGLKDAATVFKPEDTGTVAKAKNLLAQAKAELSKIAKPDDRKPGETKPGETLHSLDSPDQPKTTQPPVVDKEVQCKNLATTAINKQLTNDLRSAIDLYRQSLILCPKLCPAMANLAKAYGDLGDRNSARQWAVAAVACAPENQLYKQNAAALQASQQPPTQPVQPQTPPDIKKQCEDIVSQGIAKSKGRDLPGAIQFYQRALQLCPQHCPAMNDIGVTYEALGDKKAAKDWVDAAIKCNPNSALYKQNMTRIAAALQQLAASPPPVVSGSGFDGVYAGPIKREDGTQGPKLTWTVSGSRISQVSDADSEKRSFVGEIKPSGEFSIQVVRITYRGRVVGSLLNGSYAGELRLFNGTMNSTVKGTFSASRTTPVSTVQPPPRQPQSQASPNPDPIGTWRHSPDATWTITATGNGGYRAQETGLGNASGPASFTPSGTFRIDYITRDGSIKGYYEVRFSPDGRTASGSVQELTGPKRSGSSNWTRL